MHTQTVCVSIPDVSSFLGSKCNNLSPKLYITQNSMLLPLTATAGGGALLLARGSVLGAGTSSSPKAVQTATGHLFQGPSSCPHQPHSQMRRPVSGRVTHINAPGKRHFNFQETADAELGGLWCILSGCLPSLSFTLCDFPHSTAASPWCRADSLQTALLSSFPCAGGRSWSGTQDRLERLGCWAAESGLWFLSIFLSKFSL